MIDDIIPVTHLSEPESWALLRGRPVGRLATAVGNVPDVFPVNFVVDGGGIVFKTARGSKLLELLINNQVAFEVDSWTEDLGGWSVVCRGRARVLEDDERNHAASLDLKSWVQTIKTHFVRIDVEHIVGRAFRFGEEPSEGDRDLDPVD
jgi:nitroimidazol reductase NimA-like FMN-containing flavoprotein (pyridoxamine 5'-phosphate oxidase superfamily)